MTDTSPSPATPSTSPESKHSCRKKKFVGLLFIFFLIGGGATFYFCPWVVCIHGSATQDFARTGQSLADLENRVEALDNRLNELNGKIGQTTRATATSTETQPAVPPASAADMAHLQNDMIALSSALATLQTEVKQTGNHALHTQQATQASLAAAIGFIQLREAASVGRGFSTELAAMREATKNDGGFQEPLSRLEPYATKGAPQLSILHEELITLEVPAAMAIDKSNAQTWWEKFLVEIKGLVSIRPLHGGGALDAFTIMETNLDKGDIAAALEAMKNLPPDAQQVLSGWREKAEARQHIDDALHAIADRFTTLANSASGTQQGEP